MSNQRFVVSDALRIKVCLMSPPGVEPSGPTLDYLLLQCLIHPADGSVCRTNSEALIDVFKSCALAA